MHQPSAALSASQGENEQSAFNTDAVSESLLTWADAGQESKSSE